jgi:hypothetical protein
MKKIIIIQLSLLVLLLPVSLAYAQSPFQAGINFSMGFPQSDFSENVDNAGFGLSGHFAYQIPRTPVALGAALGFLIYGMESRKEPLSTTIPDIVVRVETTNNILTGHLLMRVQPVASNAMVRPYLEGLFGFHYLWTETSLKDWDWDENDHISSKNYDDMAMSYGGGGGLMIRVYQGKKGRSDGFYSINIDIGMRYLFGGEATYLKEGDIKRENGTVIYSPSESTTDLLTTTVGVTFTF